MAGRACRGIAVGSVIHGPDIKAAGCISGAGVAAIATYRSRHVCNGRRRFGHHAHISFARIVTGCTRRSCDGRVNRRRCPCRKAAPRMAGTAIQRSNRNMICHHILASAGTKGSRCAATVTADTGSHWQ